MANAGVSGRTIREVLGHTSWRMQEHYSRISDDTLRREYEEKYEVRFNLKGQAVRLQPDGDLSGVEWLAEKIGRRLHAVAAGWCGRHIARASSCLKRQAPLDSRRGAGTPTRGRPTGPAATPTNRRSRAHAPWRSPATGWPGFRMRG